MDDIKRELVDALCRKSFKYSEEPVFKLVSGRLSRFYVNCKPTTMSPRGMFLTGHLVLDAMQGSRASAVGGLTFGADPIAMATAMTNLFQGAWPLVDSFIGALGSFMAGSNTVSNMLFSVFQFSIAEQLNMSTI